MKLFTRDFGEVEVADTDVITFAEPIFGFDTYKKFVILYDQNNSHFVWLQSAEDRNICFILTDPAVVNASYKPELPPYAKKKLGNGDYMLWLVTVIASEFKKSTVNLKSPIAVNPDTKLAMQIILEDDFPIRCPLIKKNGGNE